MKSSKAPISILMLVMINVVAIDSLRSIPLGASFGFSLLFCYVVCASLFFIPSALVSAELTTGWPQAGGVYIWIREAFGKKLAFTVVFIQWIYNVCWYPTILSLLAATLAYIVNPAWANNTWYVLLVVISTYWLITVITLRGMKLSGLVSTATAIVGTLVPMLFIAVLGFFWLLRGNPSNMDFTLKALWPDMKLGNLVLLTGVIYSLVGMEMSAVHVQDVENKQRDYPRALYYSTIIILFSLVLSSFAVAIVVPRDQLNLVTGLLDAFSLFLGAFHLEWLMPIIAAMIIIGVVGCVGAWMIGPTRSLLVAAQDGSVPEFLQKVNSKNMPINILLVQGAIFTLICLIFLFMPSINSSFWILSNLTAQLALSTYVFIFMAAIRLRYTYPHIERGYRIPLGNVGIWIVGIAGIIASLFTVLIGFVPPDQIAIGNVKFYLGFLIVGFLGFYLTSFLLYSRARSVKNN